MASEPWNDIATLLGGYPQAGQTASELWGQYVQRNLDRLYSPPGVRCRLASDVSVPASTNVFPSWTQEDWDTDNFHSNTVNPDRITIPAGMDGIYRCDAAVVFASLVADDNGAAQNHAFVEIWKNDATSGIRHTEIFNDSGSIRTVPSTVLIATGELDLVAGDYLRARFYQNGTNEGPCVVQAAVYTHFTIRWVAPLPV